MFRTPGRTVLIAIGAASLCATLAGCGTAVTSAGTSTASVATGAALRGRVYGGQQPLVGATVYLYAAGNSGYGSAYTYTIGSSLLGNHVVTTDASGSFNITGDYTCPSSTAEIYIEAVGGTADGVAGDANPNVIMLAALGPCGNLSSSSYITLNELTTVASVWALAPFMTGPSNIGTSVGNSVGLSNAFNSVNTLVNIGYGVLNTTSLPAGATIPSAEVNTLGNILAACVNQAKGGVAGDGSTCGTLFTDATPPGGTAPTSTLMAALDIAKNPGNNVDKIFLIANKFAQFSPGLTTHPTDWTLSIRYTGSGALTKGSVPTGIAADQSGNIWVTNYGTLNHSGTAYTTNPSLVELSPQGAFMQTQTAGAYLGVAIDLSGNAWSSFDYLNKTTSGSPGTLTSFNYTTAAQQGGLTEGDIPGLAVDGSGNIWATSGSALAEFSSAGVAKSPAGGYTGGGITTPASVAITPQ